MLYKVKILTDSLRSSITAQQDSIPSSLPIHRLPSAAIAKKRGGNRTASDDARLRELETLTALWLNPEDKFLRSRPLPSERVIESGA